MLRAGIDWAEEFHLVALGRPGDGVYDIARVEHNRSAVAVLVARIARLEPDPAEVRVVIETRHGLLVEALVDAGYTVLPVNPDLIARRRGPARKKDDAEDARIACLLALDRFTGLRTLVPYGELAGELRAIARDDLRAQRDERRLLNRLRADLAAVFPAALVLAGDDLGSPVVLKLLQQWPTSEAMTPADRAEVAALAGQAKHGWPDRFAARIAAEIGDAIGQFDTPNALQCYAGKAPVTRRSDKSELVVACLLACNRYLADAVQQWAFTSLRNSGWARQFYDTQRGRGKRHQAALRALGNRWLEILWHCLTHNIAYDEAVHVANRNRSHARNTDHAA